MVIRALLVETRWDGIQRGSSEGELACCVIVVYEAWCGAQTLCVEPPGEGVVGERAIARACKRVGGNVGRDVGSCQREGNEVATRQECALRNCKEVTQASEARGIWRLRRLSYECEDLARW
jgi:hypothetical protein